MKRLSQRVLLAAAMFLLPFQKLVYLYVPDFSLLDDVPAGFASVYMKCSDLALLAALLCFVITEHKHLFTRIKVQLWLIVPTLLLIGLALHSMQAARIPLLSVFLIARLLLMIGLVLVLTRLDDMRWVIWPLVVSAALNAMLGAGQYAMRSAVGLDQFGEMQITADMPGVFVVAAEGRHYLRAFGFTVHPNILAPYLVTSIVFLLASAARRYPRDAWGETLGVAIAAMGLAVTYSRASWIAVGIGGAVLGAGLLWDRSLRARILAFRYPLLVGVIIFAMFLTTQSRQVLSRFTGAGSGVDTSGTDRVLMLQDAAAMFRNHPITGVGAYNYAVQADRTRLITPAYSHGFMWQPVHNFTVLVTTELGVGGGLVWLFLTFAPWIITILMWWRHGLSIDSLMWFAASVVLAWNGLFDHFAWSSPEGMGLMWVIWAGLALSLERLRLSSLSYKPAAAKSGDQNLEQNVGQDAPVPAVAEEDFSLVKG